MSKRLTEKEHKIQKALGIERVYVVHIIDSMAGIPGGLRHRVAAFSEEHAKKLTTKDPQWKKSYVIVSVSLPRG